MNHFLTSLERTAAPSIESRKSPRRDGLLLTNQAGLRRKNPPWPIIEQTIRELEPGTRNQFCCLQDLTGSYIQAFRAPGGYHVERRVTAGTPKGPYLHLRCCYPGGSSELMLGDDAVDAFREFCQGSQCGGWFDWQPMEI